MCVYDVMWFLERINCEDFLVIVIYQLDFSVCSLNHVKLRV